MAFPDSQVLVAAIREDRLPGEERPSPGVVVRRLPIRTRPLPRVLPIQLIKYCEWAVRVVGTALSFRPTIIQAHSLPALPIGVVIKTFTRARLLYDAHELETERNLMSARKRLVSKWLERMLMRFVDHTIVVNQTIKTWYEHAYPSHAFTVVRNVLSLSSLKASAPFSLREVCGSAPGDIVFLYLGGLDPGRGIPYLIDAFSKLGADRKMVFMGSGSLKPMLEAVVKEDSNCFLLDPVKPHEVVAVAQEADVGICLLDSDALSYRYALPNKLFEYRMAGLPAVVNEDFPEMARFLERESAGWLTPLSVPRLTELLASINRAVVSEKKAAIRALSATPSWEEEQKMLVGVYRFLETGRGASSAFPA